MRARALVLIGLAVATAACGRSDAPSPEQNRALDSAADMLDEAPANLNQVEDAGLENASAEPGEPR